MADWPTSPNRSRPWAGPTRRAWKAGDRLIQKDLAATLARIASAGPTSSIPVRPQLDRPVHGRRTTGGSLGKTWRTTRRRSDRPSTRVSAVSTSGAWASLVGRRRPAARCSTSLSGSTSRPTVPHRPVPCTASPRPCAGPIYIRAMRLGDPDFIPIPIDELISKSRADALAVDHRRSRHTKCLAGSVSDLDGEADTRPHLSSDRHRGKRGRAHLHSGR